MWTWPDSSFIKLSSERLSACLTTRRSHRSSLEAARKMGQEKTARACTASLLLAIIAPLASLLPTSDEGTDHSFEGWRVGGMLGDGEWTRVLWVGGGGKGSFRLSCAVVVAVVSKSMKLTCAVVTASARALLIRKVMSQKNSVPFCLEGSPEHTPPLRPMMKLDLLGFFFLKSVKLQ